MQPHDDHDLLTAFRAGNHEAYAVLVARHQALVQASCRRQAAPGDADDCAQAVFLLLARRPAAAACAPCLAAWLLKATWYVCRRSQRAARRRRAAESAAASAPRGISVRSEALDHLDDCLLRLPERQRAAIALHYLSGQPADQIAATLGISRDNAYQLVSRGLAALRALLARRGVVVTGTTLAALLAGEAQAAASTTAITATLGASPSAPALALATGASHAMTLAAFTPVAAIAGLALTASLAAVLASAEPAPAPTPPRPPATAAASPARPVTPPAQWLGRKAFLDLADVRMSEVATAFARQVGGTVVVDPAIAGHVFTRYVHNNQDYLPLEDPHTGWKTLVTHGAVLLYAGDPPTRIDRMSQLAAVDGLDRRLDEGMTADLATDAWSATAEVCARLAVPLVLKPGALEGLDRRPVRLLAQNLSGRDIIAWLSYLGDFHARIVDGALTVSPRTVPLPVDTTPWPLEVVAPERWMDRPVTAHFSGDELAEVLTEIGRQAGGTVVLDPGLQRSSFTMVSANFRNRKAGDCLATITRETNRKLAVLHGACLVYAGDQPPQIDRFCDLAGAGPELAARLDGAVNQYLDVDPLLAAIGLQVAFGIDADFEPETQQKLERQRQMRSGLDLRMGLHARSLRGREAVAWVSYLGGLRVRIVDGRPLIGPAPVHGIPDATTAPVEKPPEF